MRLRECASWLAAGMAALIAATSCSNGETSAYATLPEWGWLYTDPVTFVTDSVAPGADATMTVALTHNNDYPFRNIWLETTYTATDSTLRTDTLNIELCDRFGRWFGKGFGASYQIEATLPHTVAPIPASVVRVRHILRVDTLKGVEKLGIDIRP